MRFLHSICARTMSVLLLGVAILVPGSQGAMASFPGVNGDIAFASTRDGSGEIYVAHPDGSGAIRLTTAITADLDPAWSPDGRRIAFTSSRDGNAEIYVMNADGSGQTRLTTNTGGDFRPAWSPDGERIAFDSMRDGDLEIYVMNADGSGQARLTTFSGTDGQAAWSPDGQRIAFTRDLGSLNYEIYVMNADGSDQVRLTTNTELDGNPNWSPDGQRIAFSSVRGGSEDIYVMNADGSNQVPIVVHAALDTDPAWSPDGQRIAFTSERDGNPEIYVADADGSDAIRVTNNPADDMSPDWQPLESGSGTVSADVSVLASAACLELSTSSVSFGTLALGAESQAASPAVTVTNCSGSPGSLLARGTDASGPGSAWALTDATATCSDTLGMDTYRLGLSSSDLGGPLWLSTENKAVQGLAAGQSTDHTVSIFTACPGSSGGGETMTMQINYLATE